MQSQSRSNSQGARLKEALERESPLQIVGTVNAFTALLAKRAGFHAIYLSGAGVANYSFGIPDLGITTMNDVVADIERINNVCDLPMLVDADTGWGSAFNIARTVREFTRAGAAGLHLEDQVGSKRCGHRPGKVLVSAEEHCDRIKVAVDAKSDPQFVIMARTDAAAGEGLASAIDRACQYVNAGADMIFAEALGDLSEYRKFVDAVSVPVLANLTEFGKTPLFTLDQLREAGIRIALYPLSAARAMMLAAELVYTAIRKEGTQQSTLGEMMTRDKLYEVLDYHKFEEKLDQLFAK